MDDDIPLTDFVKKNDADGLHYLRSYCEFLKVQIKSQTKGTKSFKVLLAGKSPRTGLSFARRGADSETENEDMAADDNLDGSAPILNNRDDANVHWSLAEDELSTWVLLFRLHYIKQKFKLSAPKPEFEQNMSDFEVLVNVHLLDLHVNELRVVKEWLEDAAKNDTVADSNSFYFPSTFESLCSQKPSNTVTSLDPDAAVREAKSWAPSDKFALETLYASIYESIRSGNIAEAIKQAQAAQHPWLASCISAAFADFAQAGAILAAEFSETDEQVSYSLAKKSRGICRDLFNEMCHKVASEPRLSVSERAVFGLFCADVSASTLLSKTWYDILWVHYQSFYQRRAEQLMRKHGVDNKQVGADVYDSGALGSVQEPLLSTPALLFSSLLTHESPDISQMAKSPFCLLQAAIAQNQLPKLLGEVAAVLKAREQKDHREADNSDIASIADNAAFHRHNAYSIFSHPYYMRLLAHLVLFVEKAAPSQISVETITFLLEFYLKQWLDVNSPVDRTKYAHVALICSRIPILSERVSRFASFAVACLEPLLITDSVAIDWEKVEELLAQLLQTAVEFGFSKDALIDEISELLVKTTATQGQLTLFEASDWRRIGGVFICRRYEAKFTRRVIDLACEWLIDGRLDSFSALITLVQKFFPNEQNYESPELGICRQLSRLASVYNLFVEFSLADKTASNDSLLATSTALLSSITDILQSRWLESVEFTSMSLKQNDELYLNIEKSLSIIRNKYVYWLVKQYYTVLGTVCEFNEENIVNIKRMTLLVASEEFKLYQCIQEDGKMFEYLELVAVIFNNYKL